jgi:hypothetical protein
VTGDLALSICKSYLVATPVAEQAVAMSMESVVHDNWRASAAEVCVPAKYSYLSTTGIPSCVSTPTEALAVTSPLTTVILSALQGCVDPVPTRKGWP